MKYLHTMVRVTDVDASLDFYCNKLGLEELRRHDSELGLEVTVATFEVCLLDRLEPERWAGALELEVGRSGGPEPLISMPLDSASATRRTTPSTTSTATAMP